MRWYVVRVKPKMFITAMNELESQGFRSYLPLYKTRNARGGYDMKPMFGVYMFVEFDVEDEGWRAVAHTRGISRVLGASAEVPLPLPRGFVEGMMASPMLVEGDEMHVALGDKVIVLAGPLAGHAGIVQFLRGGTAKVLLHLLGRESVVSISVNQVQKS